MRATAIIQLLALALVTIFNIECTISESQDKCSLYQKLPPGEDRVCTEIFDPICASNGVTYANECTFCAEVIDANKQLKFVRFGEC